MARSPRPSTAAAQVIATSSAASTAGGARSVLRATMLLQHPAQGFVCAKLIRRCYARQVCTTHVPVHSACTAVVQAPSVLHGECCHIFKTKYLTIYACALNIASHPAWRTHTPSSAVCTLVRSTVRPRNSRASGAQHSCAARSQRSSLHGSLASFGRGEKTHLNGAA